MKSTVKKPIGSLRIVLAAALSIGVATSLIESVAHAAVTDQQGRTQTLPTKKASKKLSVRSQAKPIAPTTIVLLPLKLPTKKTAALPAKKVSKKASSVASNLPTKLPAKTSNRIQMNFDSAAPTSTTEQSVVMIPNGPMVQILPGEPTGELWQSDPNAVAAKPLTDNAADNATEAAVAKVEESPVMPEIPEVLVETANEISKEVGQDVATDLNEDAATETPETSSAMTQEVSTPQMDPLAAPLIAPIVAAPAAEAPVEATTEQFAPTAVAPMAADPTLAPLVATPAITHTPVILERPTETASPEIAPAIENLTMTVSPSRSVQQNSKYRAFVRSGYLAAQYSKLEPELKNGATLLGFSFSKDFAVGDVGTPNAEVKASLDLAYGLDQEMNLRNTRMIIGRIEGLYFFGALGAIRPLAGLGLGVSSVDVTSYRVASGTNDVYLREHAKGATFLMTPEVGARTGLGSVVSLDLTAQYLILAGGGRASDLGGALLEASLGFAF